MAIPVYLKSSSVASKVPSTSSLSLRELGVNTTDGILYLRQGTGVAGDIIIPVNPWRSSTGNTTAYNTYFTAGNVGIGTTSPSTPLQVNGTITTNSVSYTNIFDILSATLTTTSTSQVSASSLSSTTYRSVEYTIQAVQGTNYHVTKLILVHDGTTPQITEYGTNIIGTSVATYDADINTGNIRLLVTPASVNSTKFQISINAIKI
jgi:hypothetical protein